MEKQVINLSIDVTKIKKEWLQPGKDGKPKYLNLALLFNPEKDQYDNNGMIVQSVPKEIYNQDRTQKGPILGNGRVYGNQAAPQANAQPSQAPNPQTYYNQPPAPSAPQTVDDLPF